MEKEDKPTTQAKTDGSYSDFIIGEESEPYLGPSWALLMFILYVLKQVFPAEPYTSYWYFQVYILCIVAGITIFTLIKRHRFFHHEEKQKELERSSPKE